MMRSASILGLSLLLLVGCGGGEETEPERAAADSTRQASRRVTDESSQANRQPGSGASGTASRRERTQQARDNASSEVSARARLSPSNDSGVSGRVKFIQEEGGVRVEAQIRGLTPGSHGFHVHEFGDCSAADGTSAGGHFNPGGHDHGTRDASATHAGDLGNIQANPNGAAAASFVTDKISLDPSAPNSIIGRGVIVHANADDGTSQPTGAAGPRVGCGVIVSNSGDTQPITNGG